MSNINKTACFFGQLSVNEDEPYQRYEALTNCAVNSFKKFHPDIQVFRVTNDTVGEMEDILGENVEFYEHGGLTRYVLAERVMRKLNIEKMIILGVDTITCGRFDEFLNDNTDILATLNYPCKETTPYWTTPIQEFADESLGKFYDFYNLNSDVACFNNVEALSRVNQLGIEHFTPLAEQGGLNELAIVEKSFNVKVVDYPYPTSKVVYNARSKGVFGTGMNNETTPQMKFYSKDGKLFTGDNKQIKIWHYVEGLSGQNKYEFKALMDNWKFKWFNSETKAFFKEYCDCGDFFEKEYDIETDWYGVKS